MRAKPLIIWGLLAGVFVLPATALALGLGKLTVDSSLGQPLSAHVELTAAQKEELDSLAAKVADQSVYRDNNVAYPTALSRARVTIEQSASGPPQLKVTTQQAVNDPYLDLIVEVNWATGRVVRNYTFLLDPPGASEKQAVAPTAAAIRADAAPSRGARAERAERNAPAAAGPNAGQGDTYTVRRGDTLSKIAKVYKPENVSLEQMLVALLRSNESVFEDKNMNRLRSGQILTVPSADQAASVTQNEAVKVVRVQAADWRAYRDRVAGAAPATEAGQTGQAAGGKITTAVEDKGAAAQPGKDQLRLSREAGKGAGAAQVEDFAAKDKALRDANSRIADLEKTLQNMQKAAELKSQTMADLQKQAEAAKAKAAEAAKAAPPQIAAAPSATAPPAVPPVTSAPSTTSPAPAAVVPPPAPVSPPAAAPESKAVVPAAPETKAPETNAPETKAPETKAPATKVAPPTPKATKAEPSFFDDLFGNTPMWAIYAAVLGILALIAGLVAARRRTATKFEDSIISGTDIKTNTVFGSTGGGVVNTGDNSLASDFSREGLGNIDTDEVDPIAEAEVYLAYGRDAQAEEILKEALKKDAQRQEIYLKLLEIHAQHNKPSAFETVASELYSVSGGQGEVWQKAMALGRQLDPSNPMFTEAGSAAGFAAEATGADTERGAGEPAEPAPVPASAQIYSMPPDLKPEPKSGRDLDFSLDDDISLSPTSGMAPEPKTPASILAGAAQEVAKSTRGADTVAPRATPAPMAGATALAKDRESLSAQSRDTVSFEPESIPKFDLDFNLDEASRPGPTMSPIPAQAAPKSVAPRPVPEPALAAVGAGAPAPQLTRPAAAIELDKLDLAFDPQRSTFEDPTPSVLDGQWHDAATKLDLAKAYQEMGDVEGAREILQEVLHEGDDQQKSEAQGLLSKLA